MGRRECHGDIRPPGMAEEDDAVEMQHLEHSGEVSAEVGILITFGRFVAAAMTTEIGTKDAVGSKERFGHRGEDSAGESEGMKADKGGVRTHPFMDVESDAVGFDLPARWMFGVWRRHCSCPSGGALLIRAEKGLPLGGCFHRSSDSSWKRAAPAWEWARSDISLEGGRPFRGGESMLSAWLSRSYRSSVGLGRGGLKR